jgi:REP element-mobilizing transposase RayT
MAQTLTKLLVHAVFSTRGREDRIVESDEADLFAYIGGMCRAAESPLLAAGGTANHVHLLISLSKNLSVADLMLRVKRDSSLWIKSKGPQYEGFHWQDGYAAFTVGRSQVEAVRKYLAGQKEHHATTTFQDEMRTFFRRYGVEFDERYVWD